MGRVERRGFWIGIFVILIKPLSGLVTRRRWTGREHVPPTGGVIFVANHVSNVDFISMAHFVYWCGRIPRFMAKSELFAVPVVRRMLRGARQIPVYRATSSAGDALRDAVSALEAGRAVVIYPEGTITKDPDYWPMLARTGVARLALTTGAPVIPVAQWGAQEILGRSGRPRLLPRRTVTMVAGPPVDLSAHLGQPLAAPVLRAATDTVMDRVRDALATIRSQDPPAQAWNPRTSRREAPLPNADLPNADLPNADVSNADVPRQAPTAVPSATIPPASVLPATVPPAAGVEVGDLEVPDRRRA
jgi:1-acyl-sn-glycerol-3-phosphate acyltransferase